MAHSLTIVRRRKLGFGSAMSIIQTLRTQGIEANQFKTWTTRNSGVNLSESTNVILRWGCSATLPQCGTPNVHVLNKARDIHRVNNKSQFALTLSEHGLGPSVFMPDSTSLLESDKRYVWRPENHSRGANFLVTVGDTIADQLRTQGGYARPLVVKSAEYRVYCLFGRVAAVASKAPPANRHQHAWNHALGCEFENVRWDSWSIEVCDAALKAAALSGLDYAAVDVMVEEHTGTPWIIEINSAGSLPRNDDRSPSYRARCVANALGWHLKRESYTHLELNSMPSGRWRDVIHPGIWKNHPANRDEVEPTFVSSRAQ